MRPNISISRLDRAKLQAFARGEMTWAEVEGMTAQEAHNIARLGCDLAAAGRLDEARTLFEGLVETNPLDVASHAALGAVYQRLGRRDDALAEYEAALARDARHPVALANRGELRLQAGDKAGFADLANAVMADPSGETSAGRRAAALVKAMALIANDAATKPSRP